MSNDPRAAVEVVLHEERLQVNTRRVPVEKVVVRRRVVTEIRQVEVTVRHEELEVHRIPIDGLDEAPAGPPPEPLSDGAVQEVPVVQLQTRPYEGVTVWVDTLTVEQALTETVSRGHAEIDSFPPPPRTST